MQRSGSNPGRALLLITGCPGTLTVVTFTGYGYSTSAVILILPSSVVWIAQIYGATPGRKNMELSSPLTPKEHPGVSAELFMTVDMLSADAEIIVAGCAQLP